MPAIARVTKEMGAENINSQTLSQKLGCSTQAVLYHFKAIEDVQLQYRCFFFDWLTGENFDSFPILDSVYTG